MAANKNITAITVRSFVKRNEGKVFIKKTAEFDGMTDCVEQIMDNWHEAEYCLDIRRGIGLKGVYIIDGRTYYFAYEDSEFVGYRYSNCVERGIIAVKRSDLVTKEDKKAKTTKAPSTKQDKLEQATKFEIIAVCREIFVKVDRTYFKYNKGKFELVSINREKQNACASLFKADKPRIVDTYATLKKACSFLYTHFEASAAGNADKAKEFFDLYYAETH